MHYQDANLAWEIPYDTYLRIKIQKVVDAANKMSNVYSRKRGGVRIMWKLMRHGELTPTLPDSLMCVDQGWQEAPDGKRILVHYVKGFGWIPEADIAVRRR